MVTLSMISDHAAPPRSTRLQAAAAGTLGEPLAGGGVPDAAPWWQAATPSAMSSCDLPLPESTGLDSTLDSDALHDGRLHLSAVPSDTALSNFFETALADHEEFAVA